MTLEIMLQYKTDYEKRLKILKQKKAMGVMSKSERIELALLEDDLEKLKGAIEALVKLTQEEL